MANIQLQKISAGWDTSSSRQSDALDNVRFFQEDDKHEYHEHTLYLDQAIQQYVHGDCKRCIIFANSSTIHRFQHNSVIHSFFPSSFWRIIIEDLNGTFGIDRHEESPELLYDTWSTFKVKHVEGREADNTIYYRWSQVSVFTRQSSTKQFVLFIDCSSGDINLLQKMLPNNSTPLPSYIARAQRDSFVWHARFIEEMRHIYEKSGWDMRHVVRRWEKSRDKRRNDEHNVALLNEIGRHLIHGNEVLEVAVNTVNSVIHHHTQFHNNSQATEAMGADQRDCFNAVYTTIQEKLYISEKDIKAINSRAISLYERLRHEIGLAYHVAAIDLANLSRRDNATMKALALIGVLYLPGTFISGIFGSNFFNFNPSNNGATADNDADWKMSDKFWIYWAVTIPVTVFTVLVWAMLDETMEMYETLISRVKAALLSMWNRLRRAKQATTAASLP